MTRTTLKRLGIAIVCGLVGLAINIWRTGSSAPLLVGRMVTLPVAILFGPWFGIIASVIAATAGIGIFANGVWVAPLEALQKLNAQSCTCGCDLTVARCRADDPTCGVSLPLAKEIVKQIAAAR